MSQLSQLEKLKLLLESPPVSDAVLGFYLDNASDIICELRNSNLVEVQYSNLQVKMAIEMYNKIGAEGETSHSENGIMRTYQTADISNSLICQVIPMAKTPFSKIRVV